MHELGSLWGSWLSWFVLWLSFWKMAIRLLSSSSESLFGVSGIMDSSSLLMHWGLEVRQRSRFVSWLLANFSVSSPVHMQEYRKNYVWRKLVSLFITHPNASTNLAPVHGSVLVVVGACGTLSGLPNRKGSASAAAETSSSPVFSPDRCASSSPQSFSRASWSLLPPLPTLPEAPAPAKSRLAAVTLDWCIRNSSLRIENTWRGANEETHEWQTNVPWSAHWRISFSFCSLTSSSCSTATWIRLINTSNLAYPYPIEISINTHLFLQAKSLLVLVFVFHPKLSRHS